MDDWLVIQNFYNGLTPSSRGHIDAATGGAFFSLTVRAATQLVEKIVSNQGWSEEKLEKGQRGHQSVKATDILSEKMDLILKHLSTASPDLAETLQAMDSCMTCESCRNTGHSGNNCPETHEDVNYVNNNNGYRPQGQGWNQQRPQYQGNNGNFNSSNNAMSPALKDFALGQAKVNDSFSKKLAANDKIFESIDARLEVVTSALKNQLSSNKTLETRLAQLAAALPVCESGKIPGQPEVSQESVRAVTTRGGRSTKDPPYPDNAGPTTEKPKEKSQPSPPQEDSDKEEEVTTQTPQEFVDTSLLPFPNRNRKSSVDEQFARFIEVIQKIHINVPLLDAMQVPTYARYLKDILNNKRPLPTSETVKLTETCSEAILCKIPEKKKDPGYPTITCSIGPFSFNHALCDMGASVSVMPKSVFDKLEIKGLHLY